MSMLRTEIGECIVHCVRVRVEYFSFRCSQLQAICVSDIRKCFAVRDL